MYQSGEFVRAITLGMKKFGLPDIVVHGFPWSEQNQVGNTINLLSQAFAEGTPLEKGGWITLDLRKIRNASVREPHLKSLFENGSGVAQLLIIDGDREDGDPDNRLVEIAFDAYDGNDDHSKQEAMISSFFGSRDETRNVEHNVEVLAASRKAREHLPQLRDAFRAGLRPGETILLKAPFAADGGGSEWMWVEVTRWDGDSIRGLLQNDPTRVLALHAGQLVEISESKVFDYIRRYADGREEGNTTAAILERSQR